MNIANSPLCSFWQALCKVSSEHSHLLENTRSFVPLPSDAVPHICCSALSFAASFPETMKDSVECLLKPLGTNRASFLALVPGCLIKMLHLSLQKCFMLWTSSLIICCSLVRFLNRIYIVSPSVLQAGRKYLPACLKQPLFNWTSISSWLAKPESWWSKSTELQNKTRCRILPVHSKEKYSWMDELFLFLQVLALVKSCRFS